MVMVSTPRSIFGPLSGMGSFTMCQATFTAAVGVVHFCVGGCQRQ